MSINRMGRLQPDRRALGVARGRCQADRPAKAGVGPQKRAVRALAEAGGYLPLGQARFCAVRPPYWFPIVTMAVFPGNIISANACVSLISRPDADETPISAAKGQDMVNAAYPNQVNNR